MYKHAIRWPSAIDADTIDQTEETKKKLYEALRKQQLINGEVSRVEDYGVIIRFYTNLYGLLHITEITGKWVDDPNDYFQKGQRIRVYVVDIQEDKRIRKYQVSLSTKGIYPKPTRRTKRKTRTGRRIKVISSENGAGTTNKNYTTQDLMNKFNKHKR